MKTILIICCASLSMFSCGVSDSVLDSTVTPQTEAQPTQEQEIPAEPEVASTEIVLSGEISTVASGTNQTVPIGSCVPTSSAQALNLTWPSLAATSGNILVTYTVTCADVFGSTVTATVMAGASGSVGLSVNVGTDSICPDDGQAVHWNIQILNSSNVDLSGVQYDMEC